MHEIARLEREYHRLLPDRRMTGRPEPELLAAADRWSRAVWAAAEAIGPAAVDDRDRDLGLRLARRPVFVCGVHRSGTTLVRDLFDGHPQLAVLPAEGTYLGGMAHAVGRLPAAERPGFVGREWLRRLANPANQAPFWLLGRTTEEHSPWLEFARRFIAWWPILERELRGVSLFPLTTAAITWATFSNLAVAGDPTARWLEKTPTNERHLGRLWAEFPEAKVIQVVRHPAATYASRKALDDRVGAGIHDPRRVLTDLALSLRVAAENPAAKTGDHRVIRYEELLAEPESAMGRLAGFLGIAPDPCLLRPTVAGRPAQANSSFRDDAEPGSIRPAAAGEPGASLTDGERALVRAYTAVPASALGYSVDALAPGHAMWLKGRLLMGEIRRRIPIR